MALFPVLPVFMTKKHGVSFKAAYYLLSACYLKLFESPADVRHANSQFVSLGSNSARVTFTFKLFTQSLDKTCM